MSKSNSSRKFSKRLYRPMAVAALLSAGVLQPLLPVLALGTASGQGISNTATATYTDDNNNPFNATSNTVTITVAPVAGLTVKGTGITDTNGGALEAGDAVTYNFDVTNIGNTPEDIFIPGTPTTTGLTNIVVSYSINGGAAINVPAGGAVVPGVAADGVIKVFVKANVSSTGLVAGNPVSVTLGNTAPNDNSPATQNVLDAPDGANADEVRTVIGTQAYTVNKEASAFQSLPFASTVTPQAFALIKKTATSVPGATPAGNDDIITYNLNFSVLSSSPSGSYSPADLAGTNIKLENTTQSKILVSDALPAGTVLQSAPVAPAGWTTIYSTDSVDATIPIISTAAGTLPAASWSATAPALLSSVKRVGFVPTTATSITAGAAAINFPISVITSGLPVNGGLVNNIAQAFGQTAGTPNLVIDESGDANPSNFNDNGTPGPAYNPTTDTGKADPNAQGVDTNGNNTGLGSQGEVTQVTITGTVAAATDSIFNGPNGTPAAVGPTDSNDDFTNASTQPPQNQSPTAVIPATQTASFKNTVSNPGTTTLADVTAQPVAPSKAEGADGIAPTGQYGLDTDIPVGTLVTVTELINGTATTKTATYIYDLTGGVYSFKLNTGSTTPVDLGNLAPNATVSYSTSVTLPASSTLPLKAISIPMIAFSDDSPTATPGFQNETTNNITLDRVYTGYMKLFKEARILDANGTTVVQDWSSAATLPAQAAPGQFIEYRIRYQNISAAANGSGNVVLNAKSFKLIEDGTLVNNWGSFTTHQQNTVSDPGTAVTYFNSATPTKATIGTTDPASGTDVGRYENAISAPIPPAGQGTFQFRRLVK